MREQAQRQLVVRRSEPGLAQIDARVVGRDEIAREGARLRDGCVVEDAAVVERAGEKVSYHALYVEAAGAPQKIVVREAGLELDEIDRVESGAQARLTRGRFLNGNDDHLGRVGSGNVDGRARLDGGSPEQVRFVQRALASQHLGAEEDVANVEGQRFPDRALAHVIVPGDHDVFHRGLVFRVERERDDGGSRGSVDNDRRIHFGVGVSLVEQSPLEEDTRSVEPDQIERPVPAQHDMTIDLSLREQWWCRLIDDDVGDDRRRAFLDQEGDADLVAPPRNHHRINVGLAVAALPVKDADAEQIALELFMIEVFLCVEVLRLRDPAERRDDEAIAVRRGSVNVLKQIGLLHRLHALEREVDYLGVEIRNGLDILSRE